MSRADASGRDTPGLRAILDHPQGPTLRQLDYWVRVGLVTPRRTGEGARARVSFPLEAQQRAIDMARLYRAGFRADAAARVLDEARQFTNGSRTVELPGGISVWVQPLARVKS